MFEMTLVAGFDTDALGLRQRNSLAA